MPHSPITSDSQEAKDEVLQPSNLLMDSMNNRAMGYGRSIFGVGRGSKGHSDSDKSEDKGGNQRNRGFPYTEVVKSPPTLITTSPKSKGKEVRKESFRGKQTSSFTPPTKYLKRKSSPLVN